MLAGLSLVNAGRCRPWLTIVSVLSCIGKDMGVVGGEEAEPGKEVLGTSEVLRLWRRTCRAKYQQGGHTSAADLPGGAKNSAGGLEGPVSALLIAV